MFFSSPHQLGREGEEAARRFLEEKSYRMLAANYRCPLGEIDLICKDGQTLVFVEVKSRRDTRKGLPEASVTAEKQKRLSKIAEWYLKENHYRGEYPVRFDVVSVLEPADGTGRHMELFRNAFGV